MIDPRDYKNGDFFFYLAPNGCIWPVQYKGSYQYSDRLGLMVLGERDAKQILADSPVYYMDVRDLYATREEAQAAWVNGRRQKYR